MAVFAERVSQNVPGRYYVDASCIYCGLCDETAPAVFKEHGTSGWAFVFHQPKTAEEEAATREAVEGCPTASIGTDGEKYDWGKIPPYSGT